MMTKSRYLMIQIMRDATGINCPFCSTEEAAQPLIPDGCYPEIWFCPHCDTCISLKLHLSKYAETRLDAQLPDYLKDSSNDGKRNNQRHLQFTSPLRRVPQLNKLAGL